MSIDDAPVLSRAERKRAAILQAASDVFLANGYVGASMDDVAARAGVSKQTLYKHFGDKETLFHELVITTVVTADAARGDEPIVLGDDVEADLRRFARHLLHGVMQPHVLQLRRVVIAEATRFPRLGREFHDVGLGKTVARLALTIGDLQDRGVVERRRPGAGRAAPQLAGPVDPAEPGHAPRRRPWGRRRGARPLRRRRRRRLPPGLRPARQIRLSQSSGKGGPPAA